VPNGLWCLKNLKFLDLSNNKIGSQKIDGSYISEAIAECEQLVEFHASGNMLTSLPESIGELRFLEVLDLKDNRINMFPDKFGCLERLLKLNLDGNCLQSVPVCIGNLHTLSELSLAKNQIKIIEQDCLVRLRNLVMLSLHQNQL
jgi:Leucine-rich repeat (LRR) protein